MKRRSPVVALFVVAAAARSAEAPTDTAGDIVQQYLLMSHAETGTPGEARMARLRVLAELGKHPNALRAIRGALPEVDDPRKREELAEICATMIHTEGSALLLSGLLEDPDDQVRFHALQGLRRMACRKDRSGGKRIQRGPDHPPKVDGLVPTLISAAGDPAEAVRDCALFALADACDPDAVLEIRKRLQDPRTRARFLAACLLTEFQDASGLPELKAALHRLRSTGPGDEVLYWSHAEMLLASLERITGKSFGEVPLNPGLCSADRGESERYRELLDAWAAWWDWRPDEAAGGGNGQKTPRTTR